MKLHLRPLAQILLWLGLLLLILVTQFYKLDAIPWHIWDESRLAISAYEMTQTGHLLIPTVDGEPDMWSTKPPLMIWSIAGSIKLFGLSEFSTRLPSALCAAITILLVFYTSKKITSSVLAGLFSAIVLSTSLGYIRNHGTRWGEYDSMLAMFSFIAASALFQFVQTKSSQRRDKYLLLFFGALSAACLTKGVAGLLFAPGYFVYLLVKGEIVPLFKRKSFYLGVLGFIAIVLGYYLLREHYNPGFLSAVNNNELGGRFMLQNEEHSGPWDMYFHSLRYERFGNHFWLVSVSVLVVLFGTRQARSAAFYFLLQAASFLLVISSAKTKISWYDLPIYPLLAVLGGLSIWQLSQWIKGVFARINVRLTLMVLVLVLSAQPILEAWQLINRTPADFYKEASTPEHEYDIAFYLRDPKNKMKLNYSTYVYFDAVPQFKLQIYKLRQQNLDIDFAYIWHINDSMAGKKVLVHQPDVSSYIELNYNFAILDTFNQVKLYQIADKKKL